MEKQRVIPRRSPKGDDVHVSADGRTYSSRVLRVDFQDGPVDPLGLRTGVFPVELLDVAADRIRALEGPSEAVESIEAAVRALAAAGWSEAGEPQKPGPTRDAAAAARKARLAEKEKTGKV